MRSNKSFISKKLKTWVKVVLSILLIIVVFIGFTGFEFLQKDKITKLPSRPAETIMDDVNAVLYALETDSPLTTELLNNVYGACTYIDGRYDCSDFRIQSLQRMLFEHNEKLPKETQEAIKTTLLDFKYWMDQPGSDSMCLWSENHQILFATSEYLAGQMYKEDVFTNDGKTGKEHMLLAEERILIWLEQRWLYGFTEWYSNTYYVEDIAPLSNLIDFAESDEIRIKATMIMDLLLNDLATQSYQGNFVSTSGRMYEGGKKAGENNSMRSVTESIWNFEVGEDRQGMDLNFLYSNRYELPEVIRTIGYDDEAVVIKATNGLDVSELKGEGLLGQKTNQVMMQWAMEAFTNPEVIHETLTYIHKNDMLQNEFLNDFKLIDLSILRWFHLLPTISRSLDPVTNGVAIQRANTYTYKTPDYMLATAQQYHPGDFGDQQHIWSATLDGEVSVFTTHPAKPLSDKGALSNSPSYWVGNGRNPFSAQEENVNMSLYVVGNKKGFMEKNLVEYTHAYFPENKFDEVILDDNQIFGRKGDTFIAMTGKNPLEFQADREDLVQKGNITYWITELSSTSAESFEAFVDRIKQNDVSFDEGSLTLTYETSGRSLQINYNEGFFVNGSKMNTEYNRFDSPYSQTERKADIIKIEAEGQSLMLDFYQLKREVVN